MYKRNINNSFAPARFITVRGLCFLRESASHFEGDILPATATLSLLALAGLAARRRRM
ncbi:MAG: hypothetical protein E7030_03905 [Akkermansiaceae bacterium]|nr:hypothetical protein [Akkermansiaceae bacterium]